MTRQRSSIGILTTAIVVGTLLVAMPAQATAAPAAVAAVWNRPWAPPLSADHNAISATNLPGKKWTAPSSSPASPYQSRLSPQIVPASTVAAPGLGSLPYFGFDKMSLSLNISAQVNVGNGNLLLTASDGVLNGAGLALRNDRFYNGLSSAVGSFGSGWSSSLSQVDTGLAITSTTVTYRGPTGLSAKYTIAGNTFSPPAGFNATLTSNSASTDKRYTLTYNSSGENLSFSTSGYLTSDRDRNGVGTSYSYNSAGQVTTISTASGRTYTVYWVSPTSTTIDSILDSSGRRTGYTQNASGSLTGVTRIDNTTETYTYDSIGRVATITLPGLVDASTGVIVTFGYDTSNRVVSISRAGAAAPATVLASTTYSYAAGLTTVTDGNGHASTFTIDATGRVTQAKDPLSRARSQSWTSNSDVSTSTDALGSGSTPGNVSTYSYDQLNNATGVSYPTGAAASATYGQGTSCPGAGSGNPNLPKCSKDDAGNGKSFQYDAAGNLLTATDTTASGTGATLQRYTYDTAARTVCGGFAGQICTSTNGIGGITKYAYDSSGNLVTVTPPAPLGPTTYAYDSLGRVTSVTDGKNQATVFTYTVRDDVIVAHYADGNDVVGLFYANGLVQQQRDTRGAGYGAKDYQYDALGRLTRFQGPESGTVQTYTYDPVGNTLTYTDTNGTITYTYDAANQLTTLREPGGTCTSGTTAPAANSGCVKFTYDNNGKEIKRSLPGGATVSTTNDLSARPTRITAKNMTGVVVADVGYSYGVGGSTTAANDRTSIQARTSFAEIGVAAGAITSYTYDSLKRVTAAVEKSGTATTASWSYGYDAAGNRTTHTRVGATGAPAGTTNYTYNTANEITSSGGATAAWSYDADGSQTVNGATGQTATYDAHLAATAIGATSYTAFGQGNTTTLTRSYSSTRYTDSALGQASETTSAGTTAYTRSAKGETVSARTSAGSTYFIKDSLGSVIGLFDKTGAFTGGYSYSPYGETRNTITAGSAADINSLRYISGYFDRSVGLYKLGARYYDATLGRFIQYDPTGQEANPFVYAACNPINAKDPSGTVTACGAFSIVLTIVGGTLGLAAFIGLSIATGGGAAALIFGALGAASAALTPAGLITAFLAIGDRC
jgi:RHS repeat-associated protein